MFTQDLRKLFEDFFIFHVQTVRSVLNDSNVGGLTTVSGRKPDVIFGDETDFDGEMNSLTVGEEGRFLGFGIEPGFESD